MPYQTTLRGRLRPLSKGYSGLADDDRPNAPSEYQDTLHLALAALSMAPKLHALGHGMLCALHGRRN
jgi:hypothetical protein